jgi:threonine/homoserine/homoserine lactone efflux protein
VSGAFVLSSMLVIMTPGVDAALITQTVFRFARRGPALAAAAGMITAGCGHALLSITSASLLPTAGLFVAWQALGAAVLLAWGSWSLWESFHPAVPTSVTTPEPPRRRSFLVGFLSTATNPKVGLFLVAFLPQFVPPGSPTTSTLAVLAVVHLTIGAVWLCVWVELNYRLRRRTPAPGLVRLLRRLTAVLFIALAARLLTTI